MEDLHLRLVGMLSLNGLMLPANRWLDGGVESVSECIEVAGDETLRRCAGVTQLMHLLRGY